MKLPIIYSDRHVGHQPLSYLREFGKDEYPEVPKRMEIIRDTILSEEIGEFIPPDTLDFSLLSEVHSSDYLAFLKRLETKIADDEYHIPTHFSDSLPYPDSFLLQLGYFSTDVSTPVDRYIFKQALTSASCAYTAALTVRNGKKCAYSLSRPPGHHAGISSMGGFCYLNNTAVAAHYLSRFGSVAILDIDFHHGNGTQEIFYERGDVFTISLHANPKKWYPYQGFENEIGQKEGEGKNKNYILKEDSSFTEYQKKLDLALNNITIFNPNYLVVALGLDTYIKDNLGHFEITTPDYHVIAKNIADLHIPTVMIQEGGYFLEDLGKNAVNFLTGFLH